MKDSERDDTGLERGAAGPATAVDRAEPDDLEVKGSNSDGEIEVRPSVRDLEVTGQGDLEVTPDEGPDDAEPDGRLGSWFADLGSLRSGSVRRLIGADFASLTGDTMVWTAMAFAVLALGGSGFMVGIVLAAQGAGTAAMLLFGGVLADRYPRRSVMMAADLLRFASQGVIAVLLLLGHAEFWQLIAAQLVHGVGTGFYMPAGGAIVPDAVDKRFVQPTNALRGAAKSFAMLGGPALGAVAVNLAGAGLAIGVDAATFLVSAALVYGLPAVAPNGDEGEGEEDGDEGKRELSVLRELRESWASVLGELGEGWNEFRELRWLWTITVQFTLVNALVLAPFFVFGPQAAEAHGGVDAWAALLVVMAAGELVGSLGVLSWRPARPLVAATLVFLLWVFPLALLAAHAPNGWTIAGAGIAGIGSAMFGIWHETAVQGNTKADNRARLMAFDEFGSLVGVPFGFALGGLFGQLVGPEQALLGSLVFLVVAALVVLSKRCIWEVRAEGELPDDDEQGEDAGERRRPLRVERWIDGQLVEVPEGS